MHAKASTLQCSQLFAPQEIIDLQGSLELTFPVAIGRSFDRGRTYPLKNYKADDTAAKHRLELDFTTGNLNQLYQSYKLIYEAHLEGNFRLSRHKDISQNAFPCKAVQPPQHQQLFPSFF